METDLAKPKIIKKKKKKSKAIHTKLHRATVSVQFGSLKIKA